jgi:hypothetical protein
VKQSGIDAYRLKIDIRKFGDLYWQNLVDQEQSDEHFNLGLIIPHDLASEMWAPYEMKFEVYSGKRSLIGGWNNDDELYYFTIF